PGSWDNVGYRRGSRGRGLGRVVVGHGPGVGPGAVVVEARLPAHGAGLVPRLIALELHRSGGRIGDLPGQRKCLLLS
nr:hypothetical protein [Tanacetum cinerariifolium]